jgi:hypothetical protein
MEEFLNIDKKKIFISVPAYDSKIFVYGMFSIFNNVRTLEKAGYSVVFHAQMGCCYLDQTRNHIVKEFLKTDAAYLIMVDSDLAFDFDVMIKMMKHDVDIIGGAYPYRSEDLDGFPISIKLDEKRVPIGDREKMILECEFIPTGCMVIKRKVFDILTEKYPENIDESGELQHFRTGILFRDRGDIKYYGEDVYFCKICNEAGIKIWNDPKMGFVHIGELKKKGNYDEYLRGIGNGTGRIDNGNSKGPDSRGTRPN